MQVPEVDGAEAITMRAAGATWIDVREQVEWDEWHIADTQLVPLATSVDWVVRNVPDPATTLVISCRSGARSGRLVAHLREQGYSDVHNLRGGIIAWQRDGHPVVSGT
jgi:rhodanese-related sulfurtransferase